LSGNKRKQRFFAPVYIKNSQDGWIEDMQIQLTPAGDVLLIYTEHATSDEMTAPQLNAALIAQDGKVKWTQPVVRQNDPYAWYLINWAKTRIST
jgi:hypothetical protein